MRRKPRGYSMRTKMRNYYTNLLSISFDSFISKGEVGKWKSYVPWKPPKRMYRLPRDQNMFQIYILNSFLPCHFKLAPIVITQFNNHIPQKDNSMIPLSPRPVVGVNHDIRKAMTTGSRADWQENVLSLQSSLVGRQDCSARRWNSAGAFGVGDVPEKQEPGAAGIDTVKSTHVVCCRAFKTTFSGS